MFLVVRVVVSSSSDAAFSEISEFMDVYAVLTVRSESLDRAGYFGGRVDVLLTEGSHSSSVGVVGVEDANGVSFGVGGLDLVELAERSEGGSYC